VYEAVSVEEKYDLVLANCVKYEEEILGTRYDGCYIAIVDGNIVTAARNTSDQRMGERADVRRDAALSQASPPG
jgi:hypothetical protein